MPLPPFRHHERLRVRWAEVDMQQIVFNGHYLTYIDTALAGYWRALAVPYQATLSGLQGDLYLRKLSLDYQASARFDECLSVGVRCADIGRSSLRFGAAVMRDGRPLVEGDLVYVFADPATQTSRPVPPALREVLQAFEAGEPMLQTTFGAWATLADAIRELRQAVFVQEQGIAADLVFDEADATAVHALARNRLGLPLAAGRLLPVSPGLMKIGRMATRADLRGAGCARAVLAALTAQARSLGAVELRLSAQCSAVDFYCREGFEAEGPLFEEAGIVHQAMRRVL